MGVGGPGVLLKVTDTVFKKMTVAPALRRNSRWAPKFG